mmetsp:Transcript_28679/g.86699  ORF Transcript_28679/g.86699 Transcript_28679/m.86699 type:complete len:315 (-) Transcript_28679:495-1439(-)
MLSREGCACERFRCPGVGLKRHRLWLQPIDTRAPSWRVRPQRLLRRGGGCRAGDWEGQRQDGPQGHDLPRRDPGPLGRGLQFEKLQDRPRHARRHRVRGRVRRPPRSHAGADRECHRAHRGPLRPVPRHPCGQAALGFQGGVGGDFHGGGDPLDPPRHERLRGAEGRVPQPGEHLQAFRAHDGRRQKQGPYRHHARQQDPLGPRAQPLQFGADALGLRLRCVRHALQDRPLRAPVGRQLGRRRVLAREAPRAPGRRPGRHRADRDRRLRAGLRHHRRPGEEGPEDEAIGGPLHGIHRLAHAGQGPRAGESRGHW